MTTQIHKVPLNMLDGMMPHLAPFLKRGFKNVSTDPATLADEIRADLTQVWAIFHDNKLVGAFFSSIHVTPDGAKVIDVFGLGGHGAPKWARQLSDQMTEFGRRNGCARLVFAGKKGWSRICNGVGITGTRTGNHMSFERIVA
jgi:hypothetical protein